MEDWQTVALTTGHVVTGLLGGGHALLHKTDPRAAQVWLIICIFIPILGPFAYFLFGINRIETRARKLLDAQREPHSTATTPGIEEPFRRFAEIGDRVVGAPGTPDNDARALINGESAYPAMLSAIAGARHTVLLSTYIFSNDEVGHRFVAALRDATNRGVRVRVLIDAIGEWYSFPRISRALRREGVPFRRFLPPRWFPPFGYVNLRNHRKLLIVDGAIGFTGGMNIGNRHVADSKGHYRAEDVHFELRGPVVRDLVQVFADDWQFAAGERLALPAPAAPSGTRWCRVVPDGPNEDLEQLSLVIQGAIASATRSVAIMTPYFLPERDLLVGLQTAALRGLDVRIVVPRRSNLPYVDWAMQHLLPKLTERGVRVYRREPFSHAKLFVVDDRYALIGTANLDPRSLRLNFELGIEVFDDAFAAEIGRLIAANVDPLAETTSAMLAARGLPKRLRDAVLALFSPYL